MDFEVVQMNKGEGVMCKIGGRGDSLGHLAGCDNEREWGYQGEDFWKRSI